MKYQSAILLLLALMLSACGTLTEDGTGLLFRTADPRLNVGIRLQQPPPVTIEPSLMPTPTPTPCALVIKGNINAQGEHIAHSPGQANYDTVVITPEKGERLFCTLDEAVQAGWRPALR